MEQLYTQGTVPFQGGRAEGWGLALTHVNYWHRQEETTDQHERPEEEHDRGGAEEGRRSAMGGGRSAMGREERDEGEEHDRGGGAKEGRGCLKVHSALQNTDTKGLANSRGEAGPMLGFFCL